MSTAWEDFDARMREIRDLDQILGLMGWDEETYCPKSARAGRGRQTATLESIRHQRMVDPAFGARLEELLEPSANLDPTRTAMVARMKRRRERSVRLPESLVKAFAEARSLALAAWGAARAADRFADFEPHLDTIFRLSRERADALSGAEGDRYDALLDEYEPDLKSATLRPILAQLRDGLVPLAHTIAGRPAPERGFLGQPFDEGTQWTFTLRLLGDLHFELDRGRQDRSLHPFTQSCGEHDVRLTTRIFPRDPLSAIFSSIHECGHGLYEQGFEPSHFGTSLADAPSAGIHESQSRLWENQIARSRPFWNRYFPILQDVFPAELGGVGVEAFHRAVNTVAPGPIRVEADEVTYNLHILLRFELETALLSGELPVRDLPGAWNERMRAFVGYSPKNDAEGCLQDIHWAFGNVGYFPTYAIGNIYASQLMAAYEGQHPAVWEDVERGDFAPLLGWLRSHVHRSGFRLSADDTIRAATGSGLDVAPFLDYLRKKFGALYGL